MKKIHAVAIALILAVSAGLGLVAATRTAGLRGATPATAAPGSTIAARAKRLNRIEAALHRALRDRPPALPALPAAARPTTAPVPRVIYRRPAPIVIVKHRANHESEHEHESEGGEDD